MTQIATVAAHEIWLSDTALLCPAVSGSALTPDLALDYLGELSLQEDGFSPSTLERARSLYAQRAHQLAGECADGVPLPDSDTAEWLRLRLGLLQIERSRLTQLRDEGEITTPQMNAVQRDIDLELERLGRRLAAA